MAKEQLGDYVPGTYGIEGILVVDAKNEVTYAFSDAEPVSSVVDSDQPMARVIAAARAAPLDQLAVVGFAEFHGEPQLVGAHRIAYLDPSKTAADGASVLIFGQHVDQDMLNQLSQDLAACVFRRSKRRLR